MSTTEGETPSPSSTGRSNPLLVLSYATIVALWGMSQVVLVPYVIHLLVLVGAILYAACHSSLVLREEPPDPNDPMSASEHSSSSERETLRTEDAYQFPIIGSCTLFGLYLLYKFFDKDLINMLIGGYFAIVGCLALTMTISPAVSRTVIPPSLRRKNMGWEYRLAHPLPEWLAGPSPWDLSLHFTAVEVVSLLISAAVCAMYIKNKTWYLNNVLGISFCLQGIERFSLGTYKTAAILLVGLFFYDIFWVFGTEVMVTVAKSLDGPIKILFPRTLTKDEETGRIETSLLGLGDIVIPGFFLALLLRFDAHKADEPTSPPTNYHARFPKPYFHATLVAYMLGLGTTLFVMIQFNAAQPALLYLVPACLGSSFLVAILKGEVKELLEYSEEQEEEEEEEGEGEEDGAKDKESKKVD